MLIPKAVHLLILPFQMSVFRSNGNILFFKGFNPGVQFGNSGAVVAKTLNIEQGEKFRRQGSHRSTKAIELYRWREHTREFRGGLGRVDKIENQPI